MKGLLEALARWVIEWLELWLPDCPQCGSEAVRKNGAAAVAGAMLCDDCGTRWRP